MKKLYVEHTDIVLFLLFPIAASTLSFLFHTNFFFSTLLFFGIPALYLSYKNIGNVKNAVLFSAFGSLGGFVFDYVGLINNAWNVPASIFPMRILGVVPVEDLIWGFLLVYSIVMTYEHFFNTTRHSSKNTKINLWNAIHVLILMMFFLVFFFMPTLFRIDYFYVKTGSLFILIPSLSFLIFYPMLISRFIKIGTYFFFQGLLFELTGLSLNQWNFEGAQSIGWIHILSVRFPIEECIFWLLLFAVCIVSFYEFFYDDRK